MKKRINTLVDVRVHKMVTKAKFRAETTSLSELLAKLLESTNLLTEDEKIGLREYLAEQESE